MAKTCLLTLFSLIILFSHVLGAPSESLCSEEDLAIKYGNYTLSKGLQTGSVLIYHCPSGFYSPVRTRRCLHGKWDPPPKHSRPTRHGLQCKLIQCPNPMVFEHGSVQPVQDRYYVNNITTYECHSDFRFTGSATRICKANGKWNGSTPICTFADDDCPDPGLPAGTRRTGNFFNAGDKVSYHCEDGLTLIGSKERTCKKSGEWTGREPECYYAHTYDTSEDISQVFSGRLENILSTNANSQDGGKKIMLNQAGSVNIYIALDVSDSISEAYFNMSKKVTKNLIEKISYYEVSPRYDIICFATRVIPIVDIRSSYTGRQKELTQVIEDLDRFDYNGKGDNRGTDIAGAFQSIYEKMALMRNADQAQFQNTSHVIIMFTDGEANMGGKPEYKIEKLKNLFNEDSLKNLDIFIFGVGDISKDYINRFATHRANEKHVFYVEDTDKLHEMFDKMLDESTSVGLCGLHRDYRYEDFIHRTLKQPWLAEINIMHEEGPVSKCLGSLITPRFILTAAHCFKFGDTEERVNVKFSSGKIPEVKKFILHKEYNIGSKKKDGIPEFYDYDVALIELKETVDISVITRPICIPCTKETSAALKLYGADVTCKQHEDTLLNKDHVAALFMSPKRKMKHVLIKQGAHVKEYCYKKASNAKGVSPSVQYTDLVTERFLCTGGINPQIDDAVCRGEAGGALFLERNHRSIQVGVISWGVSDVCTYNRDQSNGDHRDYHISLFKVQQFLKDNLKDELTFLN